MFINRVFVAASAIVFLVPVVSPAQVFDPGPSDPELFDNVINLSTSSGPNSIGGTRGETTQLNVLAGGMVGFGFDANFGGEVNINGGHVAPACNVSFGSELNICDGTLGGSCIAFEGSVVNISGGEVGIFFDVVGADVNITGGIVGDLLLVEANSIVNISGGVIGDGCSALSGSTINISGGNIGDDFGASNGSEVNLFGTEFAIDGRPLENLETGQPFTILAREVTLTGLFSDGSPINFDLELDSLSDGDFFANGAALTVTLDEPFVLGDVNCDGAVNLLDVQPFVEAIPNGMFDPKADLNQDGMVNLLDVEPFVALLSGG